MARLFENHPEVLLAISERADGDLRVQTRGRPETGAIYAANRHKFFEKSGVRPESVAASLLEHGSNVVPVGPAQAGQFIAHCDALITATPGVFVSITIADCLPVFLYDPASHAIGLAHAGWRGLAAKIIPKTIAAMQAEFGSDPAVMFAAIGPGIGSCHYAVQADLAQKFSEYAAVEQRHGELFLDLKLVAQKQLLAAGVAAARLEVDPDCTADFPEKYFSFRRDKPAAVQAMAAVFGLRPPESKLQHG